MYLRIYICNSYYFSEASCCFILAEIYRRIIFIVRYQAFFAVFLYINTSIKQENTHFSLANTGARLYQNDISIMIFLFHTVARNRNCIICLLRFRCVLNSERFSNGFIKKQPGSSTCCAIVVSYLTGIVQGQAFLGGVDPLRPVLFFLFHRSFGSEFGESFSTF